MSKDGISLNILNGQAMYIFMKDNGMFHNSNVYIPFNEAMCVGDVCVDIFADEFISMRSKAHSVTKQDYISYVIEPLSPLFENNFDNIILWFDDDMFCQINLLTLLAYLDRYGYSKNMTYNLVSRHFELVDCFTINPTGFMDIYKSVLIDKCMPRDILLPVLRRGIVNYLNYKKEHNEITSYIKNNIEIDKNTLIKKLINKFQQYGLGDVQYNELIDRYKT